MKIKVNALLSPDGQILKTILTTDSKMPVNLTRRASFLHVMCLSEIFLEGKRIFKNGGHRLCK